MLNYRVNIKNIDKTKVVLPVTSIQFLDFNEIYDEENEIVEYNGINIDKIILTCECEDIDKLKNGTTINTVNTLILNYGTYTFNKEFKVNGVNEDNRSFSIISNAIAHPNQNITSLIIIHLLAILCIYIIYYLGGFMYGNLYYK